MHRFNKRILITVALLIAATTVLIDAQTSEPEDSIESINNDASTIKLTARQLFQLPKLFDFEAFKQKFKRTYGSILEESERKRLYLARQSRASISWLKYKLGLASYCYAINDFSDQSSLELAQMYNRVPESVLDERAKVETLDERDEKSFADLMSKQDSENSLHQIVVSSEPKGQNSPFVQRSSSTISLSNDSSSSDATRPQELPWTALKPLDVWINIAGKAPELSIENHVMSLPKDLAQQEYQPDEVFFDLRETNCISKPLQQDNCASCYAMAAVTLAEFIYCKRTGSLIPFSPQYVVDCGHSVGNKGCVGSSLLPMAKFVQNFGMELAALYPYRARQFTCPYGDNTKPNEMGRIQLEFTHITVLNEDQFEKYLKLGPILIIMNCPSDFHEYGSGIMDGSMDIQKDSSHIVVVVGHGRANNQEYWLVKNSHGINWGEEGYFKLKKTSGLIRNLLKGDRRNQGSMFGKINDQDELELKAQANSDNDSSFLSRYMRTDGRILYHLSESEQSVRWMH